MIKPSFLDDEHKSFFTSSLHRCKTLDCYHISFFYVIGLTFETRKNIDLLFDFEQDIICPEGIYDAWQTTTTQNVCRFAFNLWNGFIESQDACLYTPDTLFSTALSPYFVEALKLRFADYL